MSKLKVGDITIENGSISFSQQQTSNVEPTPVPNHTPPGKESSLKETMASLPGPSILWIGAAILSPIVGYIIWSFISSLLLIVVPPLVFFGIFSLGVAFIKLSHAQNVEKDALVQEQNLLLEQRKKLLSTLENKSEKWTFEKLYETLDLPQEELLIALKASVDEKQV